MMGGMRQPAPPKADDGKATTLLDALHIAWDNGRAVWDAFNPHPEFASVIQEFIFISPKSGTRGAFNHDERDHQRPAGNAGRLRRRDPADARRPAP